MKQRTRKGKAALTSSDITEENLKNLQQLFPEVFREGKIQWDIFRTILGDKVESSGDKFTFSWSGKTKAVKNVLTPSKGTFQPSKKEGVDFENSENIFIEGDNLESLKLLQKPYFEKIKMVYIDPPYNTGNDFVYKDDFVAPLQSYLEQTGQVDDKGNKLQTNSETSGRYHSSWLSMMYPRLKLAWNLLRDDGVIFVSIDDNEIHHLRMLMDEIFGEENFIVQFIWRKKSGGGQQDEFVVREHEYILCFAKNRASFSFIDKVAPVSEKGFSLLDKKKNRQYKLVKLAKWGSGALKQDRPTMYFPLTDPDGGENFPIAPDGRDGRWRYGKQRVKTLLEENGIEWAKKQDKWIPYEKVYKPEDGEGQILKERSILYDLVENTSGTNELTEIFGKKDFFPFPKPSELVRHLVYLATEEDDIVLDFFAGSGTTAHAVLKQNQQDGHRRKFILIQLPELIDPKTEAYKAGYKNICEITKERMRRLIKGYGKTPKPITDGFKVFKLTKSNYLENNFLFDPDKSAKENEKAFKAYLVGAKQASLFKDSNDLDVVFENILKEGLSLNASIKETKVGENNFYEVFDNERSLLICLEKKIHKETVKELMKKAYKERVFVCLDESLDDTSKGNLGLHLELKTV